MKKTLAIILALCLGASMLAACGGSGSSAPASASVGGSTGSSAPEAKPVEIRVVTSYGGDDGNRANYEEAVAGYEAATGNTVVDESATSNEQWKAQVKADFQTGSEPDVLFFFTGTDASEFIKNGKVVSIEEIRKEYPDYASNMLDAAMPPFLCGRQGLRRSVQRILGRHVREQNRSGRLRPGGPRPRYDLGRVHGDV